MRTLFGVLSLLVGVAVIAVLARKQLAPTAAPAAAPDQTAARPAGTPAQQVRQFQHAVDAALRQPRAVPEDK